MKIVLAVAIASLCLTGCGSMDFFGDSSSSQPASTPDTAAAPEAPTAANVAAPAPTAAMDTSSGGDTAAAQNPIAQSPPPPAAVATASTRAHCIALAKQRATDAAFQGEDGDTQETVYNRTYSDCVAWDLKHNL